MKRSFAKSRIKLEVFCGHNSHIEWNKSSEFQHLHYMRYKIDVESV